MSYAEMDAGDDEEEEEEEEEEAPPDPECHVCGSTEDAPTMLLCDRCDTGYHMK